MPESLRAFRFALDPTTVQLDLLSQHAGAARWAFNHALGVKRAAHSLRLAQIAQLMAEGVPQAQARQQADRVPNKPDIQLTLNRIKGDSRRQAPTDGTLGPHRPCPWWWETSTYAMQSAMEDADRAWKNWGASVTGQRAGRRVGYPRFKKKGRCRESFRLHHDVKKPTIRLDGYRRLQLPRIGSVRMHESAKRLARLTDRGEGLIKSVTISRGGHRWYASVLVATTSPLPTRPTKAARARGRIGVDLGVHTLAAVSQPLALTPGATQTHLVPNPRHANAGRKQLTRAQQAFARTTKGSQRRKKAARRIGRIQHQIAERRATALHTLTKRLAAGFAEIAVEDLDVRAMTATGRGTLEAPGTMVKQKAGFNRAVLDASFAELRRQLTYKTSWYGSTLDVCERWFPSSKTCSSCGWRNPNLKRGDRTFTCAQCGLSIDRDLNAAYNLQHHTVAPGKEETQNARNGRTPKALPPQADGRASPPEREGPGTLGVTPDEQSSGHLPSAHSHTLRVTKLQSAHNSPAQ
ncbi:RNA-guided endonuclease InsQ/TnpB family protein [Streptomyces celluloflavus]|uniref:RNA-guided endonuclease InsQ/TnpB family protein n=1 Tax=Streptomyces celluloflavus TaxID=58344 RepID=UPI0036DDE1D9